MRGNHAKEKEFNFISVLKIILVFAIIGAIVFFAMNVINNMNENTRNKEIVDNVINTSFNALKNSDKENINKYLDYNKLVAGLDEMLIKEKNNNEFDQELFKNISWSIESCDVKKDEATAIIELTNKNFKNILTKWMKELINEVNNGNEIDEDVSIHKLENIIKNETETKTELKKIKVKMYEDTWKIVVNDDLIDLVFPGIDAITKILN